MLSYEEIHKILHDVECEPYEIHMSCIQCTREDTPFILCEDNSHAWYVQLLLERKDIDTGEISIGHGAKYFLSPHMTVGEIARKVLVAALAYATHEVHEAFRYRGAQVYGPHMDIDALVEIADRKEYRAQAPAL